MQRLEVGGAVRPPIRVVRLQRVNWEFVINCAVYGVICVLRLSDCQIALPGLKLKETQDVSELIILGFNIKLLE